MRGDTAIGHVDAHNELRDGILREAERFGVKVDIGGPYKTGDPAHIQEHNKTRTALDLLAKTAGITVVLPAIHKLGDTGHAPGDHDKLAQALALISKADAWNDATGGTITDYTLDGKRYRVHTFAASGTLVVKRSVRPWRVLAVGGGTGGGGGGPYCQEGAPGASGEAIEKALALTPQGYPVTVGGGSSVADLAARDAANTARIQSNITGTMTSYPNSNGGPGGCGSPGSPGGPGLFPGGAGGGGGGIGNAPPFDGGPGGPGAGGAVYVSYQIGLAS